MPLDRSLRLRRVYGWRNVARLVCLCSALGEQQGAQRGKLQCLRRGKHSQFVPAPCHPCGDKPTRRRPVGGSTISASDASVWQLRTHDVFQLRRYGGQFFQWMRRRSLEVRPMTTGRWKVGPCRRVLSGLTWLTTASSQPAKLLPLSRQRWAG